MTEEVVEAVERVTWAPSELAEKVLKSLEGDLDVCKSVSETKKDTFEEYKRLMGQWHVLQGFEMQLYTVDSAGGPASLSVQDFDHTKSRDHVGFVGVKDKEDGAGASASPQPSDGHVSKLSKWLKHQPPARLLSLRKRRNKLALATLNARYATELGDAAAVSEGKDNISSLWPLQVDGRHGAFASLYHDALGTLFAESDAADQSPYDQLEILKGALVELTWVKNVLEPPAPNKDAAMPPEVLAALTGAIPPPRATTLSASAAGAGFGGTAGGGGVMAATRTLTGATPIAAAANSSVGGRDEIAADLDRLGPAGDQLLADVKSLRYEIKRKYDAIKSVVEANERQDALPVALHPTLVPAPSGRRVTVAIAGSSASPSPHHVSANGGVAMPPVQEENMPGEVAPRASSFNDKPPPNPRSLRFMASREKDEMKAIEAGHAEGGSTPPRPLKKPGQAFRTVSQRVGGSQASSHSPRSPRGSADSAMESPSKKFPWDFPQFFAAAKQGPGLYGTLLGGSPSAAMGSTIIDGGPSHGRSDSVLMFSPVATSTNPHITPLPSGSITIPSPPHHPPEYLHVVGGLDMLYQWRAKRTRQQLLAAAGARRALVCLNLGIEWNLAGMREKYKGAQRRVAKELLLHSTAAADVVSGTVEAAWLHGCKKVAGDLKSLAHSGTLDGHGVAAVAPTRPTGAKPAARRATILPDSVIAGEDGLKTVHVAPAGAAASSSAHPPPHGHDSKATQVQNVVRVLKHKIGDLWRELERSSANLENLSRQATMSARNDVLRVKSAALDKAIAECNVKAMRDLRTKELHDEVVRRLKHVVAKAGEMSAGARAHAMTVIGELLALYRVMEYVLSDGVSQAQTMLGSEIASVSGEVHSAAHDEANKAAAYVAERLTEWQSLQGKLVAVSGIPETGGEAARKALMMKRQELKLKSVMARQQLATSDVLLANIQNAKLRLYESQYVLAFLCDDLYVSELERLVQASMNPLLGGLTITTGGGGSSVASTTSPTLAPAPAPGPKVSELQLPSLTSPEAKPLGPRRSSIVRPSALSSAATVVDADPSTPERKVSSIELQLTSPRYKNMTIVSPHAKDWKQAMSVFSPIARDVTGASGRIGSGRMSDVPLTPGPAPSSAVNRLRVSDAAAAAGGSTRKLKLFGGSHRRVDSNGEVKEMSSHGSFSVQPTKPRLLHSVVEGLRSVYRHAKAALQEDAMAGLVHRRARGMVYRAKGSLAFWTNAAPQLCVPARRPGSFSFRNNMIPHIDSGRVMGAAEDEHDTFVSNVSDDDYDFDNPEEVGIVYDFKEAARDAALQLASAAKSKQFYNNTAAVRSQYAHASAELWVTRKFQQGLPRQTVFDIAMAKREGVEMELRLMTMDNWAKRTLRDAYISEGQVVAMKALLWGVPENKALAAKFVRHKQQMLSADIVHLVRRRTIAKFHDMEAIALRAAMKMMQRLCKTFYAGDYFAELTGGATSITTGAAAGVTFGVKFEQSGPLYGASESMKSSRSSKGDKPRVTIPEQPVMSEDALSSHNRKVSVTDTPHTRTSVTFVSRNSLLNSSGHLTSPVAPGSNISGGSGSPDKKGPTLPGLEEESVVTKVESVVTGDGSDVGARVVAVRSESPSSANSSEHTSSPVRKSAHTSPSPSGGLLRSRVGTHNSAEGPDAQPPALFPSDAALRIDTTAPTEPKSASPTVSPFTMMKITKTLRNKSKSPHTRTASNSPQYNRFLTSDSALPPPFFAWPEEPEWQHIRLIDQHLQRWLWTTFSELAAEQTHIRDYTYAKLLNKLDRGIEAAVKLVFDFDAAQDALPDGFKLPHARETTRNRWKRRFLIAVGYYLALHRMHANLTRLNMDSRVSVSSTTMLSSSMPSHTTAL